VQLLGPTSRATTRLPDRRHGVEHRSPSLTAASPKGCRSSARRESGQRGTVRDRRTTAFRARRTRRNQRSEQRSKGVGNKRCCHSPPGGKCMPPLLQPNRSCWAA
jgi:hypothetical protein